MTKTTDGPLKIDERATAGQLALEILHEIRNPLEALGHLTFLALQDCEQPEKVREYMKLAEEQVATLSRIASQTLAFARVSHLPTRIDLVDLTEAALRIHQRTIEHKKIHLVRTAPKDLMAEVHSGQMLQALSNVIVNSLEALPESGILSLRLRRRGPRIELLIADNGSGIPEQHLLNIFEPFFTTKEESGNGLGLAISKRIVEDHRGSIRIRSSTRPGRSGTAFKISLPA